MADLKFIINDDEVIVIDEERDTEEYFTREEAIQIWGPEIFDPEPELYPGDPQEYIENYEGIDEDLDETEVDWDEEIAKYEEQEIKKLTQQYWDAYDALIKELGRYANSEKFRKNVQEMTMDGIDHKVLDVRARYGQYGTAQDLAHKQLRIDGYVRILNDLCEELGLEPLPENLAKVLQDIVVTCNANERTKYFYTPIRKYKKNGELHEPRKIIDDFLSAQGR